MNWRAVVLVAACACWKTAWAGHGLMNSFADVTALPPAGITPAVPTWLLDRFAERAVLYLAAGPRAQAHYAERYARERLAEFVDATHASHSAAAARAAQAYRDDMSRALGALDDGGRREVAEVSGRLALALLEHQYLLSLAYLDLPVTGRPAAEALFEWMQIRYGPLRARLGAGYADSLFFKEEEVRWSWEMAVRADEVEP